MSASVQRIFWILSIYGIHIQSVNIDCATSNSQCSGSSYSCPSSDSVCNINCGGSGGSCIGSSFTIQNTGVESDIAQIYCNTKFSCNRIKIYSQRAINLHCIANSSCSNAYVNITWNDRNTNSMAPSTFDITEPDNENFNFICAGGAIPMCTLSCGSSPTYPNGGVTLCRNGLFDSDLPQSTCK